MTHLKQITDVVGVMINLKIVTTVVTSTTYKLIVWVLLDCGHNGHLVVVTKDKPMLFPYLNRLVPKLWILGMGSPKSAKLRGG
jgi:hypothetical protein